MAHIVLCGDSIFDNRSYVNITQGELEVTSQVESLLPTGSEVSILALDGDVTKGVPDQLIRLPGESTHIFISVGGNDALGNLEILSREVNTVGEALLLLSEMRNEFEKEYHAMLERALLYGLPLTVCTIYYPRFDAATGLERISDYLFGTNKGKVMQQMAMGALAVYNDIITKEAFQAGIPLIDLRVLCNEEQDFANPIEPSEKGGQKIARLIKEITFSHDFSQKESVVYC
jgi:lysophospholipase L1-like esterase